MCIFDFLDILFGKDAKKDKQNAIPFTDGEEECDNCGDYTKIASAIATTRNATDNRECAHFCKKSMATGYSCRF